MELPQLSKIPSTALRRLRPLMLRSSENGGAYRLLATVPRYLRCPLVLHRQAKPDETAREDGRHPIEIGTEGVGLRSDRIGVEHIEDRDLGSNFDSRRADTLREVQVQLVHRVEE